MNPRPLKILKAILKREDAWWILKLSIYETGLALFIKYFWISSVTGMIVFFGIKALITVLNGPPCPECSFGIAVTGLVVFGTFPGFLGSFIMCLIAFLNVIYYIPFCKHRETRIEAYPPGFPFHKTATETCTKCGKSWEVNVKV